MSNEFEPESVERWTAPSDWSENGKWMNAAKVVRASDYDQLLALYRQLQQSTAMLEKLYAARHEELKELVRDFEEMRAETDNRAWEPKRMRVK